MWPSIATDTGDVVDIKPNRSHGEDDDMRAAKIKRPAEQIAGVPPIVSQGCPLEWRNKAR
jgi:hypothetical protein